MHVNLVFVFFAMFFCHVVDDFALQGILANMKQREWWMKNYPNKLYKRDYLICLFEHAFEWSFAIHIPIAIHCGFNVGSFYVISLILNTLFHAVVDHLKANDHKINLIQDQGAHFLQIISTFMSYIAFM